MSLATIERIEVLVLREEQRLFRVCRSRSDDQFDKSVRSHYELGRPARGPEQQAAVLHMALSMFDHWEPAERLAKRASKLGGHIAEMHLRPGHGICLAKTGRAGHWSVWGRPDDLLECVSDVIEIST